MQTKSEKIKPFFIVIWDFNRDNVEHYDIMPYLLSVYKNRKKKDQPKTFDETKEFILKESRYQFWARCEYEVILHAWPPRTNGYEHKMDAFEQIHMNIDVITDCFLYNIKEK